MYEKTLAFLLVLASLHYKLALAQSVGDQVVVRTATALEREGRSVDDLGPGQILKVQRVDGGKFWVSRGEPGWIAKSAVIPLADAESHFSRIFTTGAGSADYLARGNVRIALGKTDEGIADLRRAVDMAGDKLPYLEALGFGLLAASQQIDAVNSFGQALKLKNSASALMGRGLAFFQMGQADNAKADFEQAMALEPSHAFPRKYLAALLHDEGELDAALRHLFAAIELDPWDVFSRKAAGRLMYDLNRYDEALKQFEFACQIDPRDSEAVAGKGVLLHAIGTDLPAARVAFESAIAVCRPSLDTAYIWNNLGQVLIELDEYSLALENLDRAIALDPFLNEARSHRAWLISKHYPIDKQLVTTAKEDMNRVWKSTDPKTYWDFRAAASLYDLYAQRAKAIEFQQQAVRLVATTAPARFRAVAEHELTALEAKQHE